ncbi:MAG: sulfite exporter TauE/SafE family protein [Candidatus Thorarchaeota archaeon]
MEITFTLIILLVIFGFISGLISIIAGVGGGVFFVSILTLLFLIPIDIAVDTSTFVILLSSLAGFIAYLKQKRTNLKLSLIFTLFSLLGSIIASILFSFIKIENIILKIIFAFTLLTAGVNMIYKAIKSKKGEDINKKVSDNFSLETHDYKTNLKKTIPLFMMAGFVANFLGIGGGIINTPALNILLHFPIHNSTAISTSIIFFTAIYNTIIKLISGHIDIILGVILAIGSIIGAILGARLSKRMPKVLLQFFVASVLILLAVRMFF